ncbi:MAG: hypothetical protein CVV10_05100 [Gammaproteobacteria bacterium HGW-Gammaproteobacteria-14]|nr:MAG: hypothetical protein CVV10_05100 [Gammaproteobacteria bacterium HGW-Gammaproteobacteria-14]
MLHLVAFPPSQTDLLPQFSALLNQGDAIVLLDEGLAWLKNPDQLIASASQTALHWYALISDQDLACDARIQPLNYSDFIALSEAHPACACWYP